MTESTAPEEKPTAEQLEAEIAETREHLAASVDQLAAKLDVKTQAQDKIADTKAQAQEKVHQATDTVKDTGQDLVARFKAASRPIQAAIVGGPLAILVVIIIGRARRG